MQVTIIGGGVIGLCTAYYLRKEGYEVTVVERHDITDGCSFGNMGYISPSHFTPIATPGIVSQGMKWMMSASSPFYIKPRLNLDLMRWGSTFFRSATAAHVTASAPHLNNLLQLSRELMTDLTHDLPGFTMVEKGCWMLYKSERVADHEKHLAEQAAGYGLKTISCTAAEVQEYEQDVEVNVAGGVLYLDDCHIDPAAFMKSLHDRLIEMGVRFMLNTTVTAFKRQNNAVTAVITNKGEISAEQLVMANGSWMGQLSKLLGIRILMQPGKGYSMVYQDLGKNLRYPSILVDHRTATAPIGSRLRIGGTMELSGHSDNILPRRVSAIYNAFRKYYPTIDVPPPDTGKAWYGYRPVSPDGMPYIGKHPKYSNLLYAGGHAMLGVSAAAGTGKLITDLVGNRAAPFALHAFRPERFG